MSSAYWSGPPQQSHYLVWPLGEINCPPLDKRHLLYDLFFFLFTLSIWIYTLYQYSSINSINSHSSPSSCRLSRTFKSSILPSIFFPCQVYVIPSICRSFHLLPPHCPFSLSLILSRLTLHLSITPFSILLSILLSSLFYHLHCIISPFF